MTVYPRRFLVISFLILLIGAGWIWISRDTGNLATEGIISAPQQGFMAPDFNLPARGGGTLSLAELRGQPVVINFWTSWCPPCQAEMPDIQRVYEEYQEQGLTIVGINATNQDSIADARNFLDQNNLSFPVVFDIGGRASYDYQVRSLPTTYFIDRRGIIREIIVGGPMSEALLRIRVEEIMREKP
jgi:peroxiredoxin